MMVFLYDIAVPSPLHQLFTYSSDVKLTAGQRVKIPFGSRTMIGVVWNQKPQSELKRLKIKSILSICEPFPVYNQEALKLAHWLTNYYVHPIGEVLKAMLPAGTTSATKQNFRINRKALQEQELTKEQRTTLAGAFKRKDTLSAATIKKKLNSGDLKQAIAKGIIEKEDNKEIATRSMMPMEPNTRRLTKELSSPPLTKIQAKVLSSIKEAFKQNELRPYLLHGVTGSGKTLIYLHLIHALLQENTDSQILVLVPEISLTPQMTQIFEQHFPNEVCVVHSQLTAKQKWDQREQVRTGTRRILIGPRSAVFAPFRNLKLICVDEEHDQSYKQHSGLRYHGRDTAIVRAKIEGCPIILGSATPALETLWNARSGKYHLGSLTERANKQPLPKIELVEPPGSQALIWSTNHIAEAEKLDVDVIHPKIVEALTETHEQGLQSMLVVPRRGYAYYLYDLVEKKVVSCKHCNISLTAHKSSNQLRCHYCDYNTSIAELLKKHPQKKFAAIGHGSQKIEAVLKKLIPSATIERVDSDTTDTKGKLPEILKRFREHTTDILVGTQMLAKGHDFPKVALTVIQGADQALGFPDFRSGERTFQLLLQASGRSGRGDVEGRVIIESRNLEHPIICAAMHHDFEGFSNQELTLRQLYGYPPFARMGIIEIESKNNYHLMKVCDQIHHWLEKQPRTERIKVSGPLKPSIDFVRNYHRQIVLITSCHLNEIQRFMLEFQGQFQRGRSGVRFHFDVDPQNAC